ncbi:MAG: hypothetical protein Q9160_008736 [Pyrenula sp. 1 TL-2023]
MATSTEDTLAPSIQNISLTDPDKPPKLHSPLTPNTFPPTEAYNIPSPATSASTPDPPLSPNPATPPHLSHSPTKNLKRSDPFQFGSRFLDESTSDVFEFNAWDHVTPDATYTTHCESQYARQRANPASAFDISRFNASPHKYWDRFYSHKRNTFFKDRKWLRQEFPVLGEVTRKGAGRKVVLEVGAGAGNTAFPILRANENEELEIWAADYSRKAVEVMEQGKREEFADDSQQAKGTLHPVVWDVSSEELPSGLSEGSVDIILLIFIFSALSPSQWRAAVANIHRLLKPGGEVLFRDYGRGDLAQVRFKDGRWMGENFYARGDGTRVYFFEQEEVRRIWAEGDFRPYGDAVVEKEDEAKAGGVHSWREDSSRQDPIARKGSTEAASADGADGDGDTRPATSNATQNTQCAEDTANNTSPSASPPPTSPSPSPSLFLIPALSLDRRLLINRQRRLKMYRCWLQGRFQKPKPPTPDPAA